MQDTEAVGFTAAATSDEALDMVPRLFSHLLAMDDRIPIGSKPAVIHPRFSVSCLPTIRGLTLPWFAFQRLANREKEDGTLVFCVR
jgi:hypothetical protein